MALLSYFTGQRLANNICWECQLKVGITPGSPFWQFQSFLPLSWVYVTFEPPFFNLLLLYLPEFIQNQAYSEGIPTNQKIKLYNVIFL